MNKNQRGFGVLLVLLGIVILAVVALSGWWVWHSAQQASSSSSTSNIGQTKPVAYTNTKYGYSVDYPSKYHAVVALGEENHPLAQADQVYILPLDQKLGQSGGETILMSIQQEGTDFSQQTFRSAFMPDWEMTFSNTTVGNSQAMQSKVVKYTGHPDLSADDYFVKAKSGNVFFISILHGNADAQAMLNSFVGN